VSQAGGLPATAGWKARGRYRELRGHRIFTIDAPSLGPEIHEPLLILHGFPTSSFDYADVLDPLRSGRRVILFDGLGYGLSDKPDVRYTVALQADLAMALVAELGLTRLALLTHDVGDTVGGELLARRAEGSWTVDVTRRVITNGSIYIRQAHLTNGQHLLLSLPDRKLATDAPVTAATITRSLRETYSPVASPPPEDSAGDPLAATVEQIMRHDGHLLLTRLIRYIEERRQNESRFTGAIETDHSPLHIVWGMDDPVAVPSMVDTLLAARPDATVVRLEGVGHYPMVEAPVLFVASVLPGLRDDADAPLH
jgi:pimeloyl-ACP methyl ester carboxylesterase